MTDEKLIEIVKTSYNIESDAINKSFDALDGCEFARAVAALAAAERIAASGCGHTGIACMHFAHLMCCIERPARFIPPSEALHGASGFIQRGDAVLLASRGGKTTELLPVMEIARKKGAVIIAVTENKESPLAKGADIVLGISVTRECDRFNCQGTTSFTVTNALFDALQTALIEYTGYDVGKFAVAHPGGAVGERLNGKS